MSCPGCRAICKLSCRQYTYDSLGRRTQVGGSFAQTGLPTAVTSATYDAANELTNWNGLTISYDLNGNMLSDGTDGGVPFCKAHEDDAALGGQNRLTNSMSLALQFRVDQPVSQIQLIECWMQVHCSRRTYGLVSS